MPEQESWNDEEPRGPVPPAPPAPAPHAGTPHPGPYTGTPHDVVRHDPGALPAPQPHQPIHRRHGDHYYASAYPAVPAPLKDVGVAYLLWFFLGGFGGHHFYLRRPGRGAAVLALTLLGWISAVVLIGFVVLGAVFVWWVVDAFLLPDRVRRLNRAIAATNAVAQQQRGPTGDDRLR